MNTEDLQVIAVISNPVLYQSRYRLYERFRERILAQGASLWTIELQHGARRHAIAEAPTLNPNERHIKVWTSALPGELWHKENLINLCIWHMTVRKPDWRYVAWVDADLLLPDGCLVDTIQALQHWDMVQMFSHAVDLGPDGDVTAVHKGFAYSYWKGFPIKNENGYLIGGHPGFAWAARRETLNKLGMLIDWAILGSADRHMCCAVFDVAAETYPPGMSEAYLRWLEIWKNRALSQLKKNVGYVPGTVQHMWHGRKSLRGYKSRWLILKEHQYNPESDIIRDVSGVLCLAPGKPEFRDDIREYFRSRNEDSIDRE